jgi:hypothetical protein
MSHDDEKTQFWSIDDDPEIPDDGPVADDRDGPNDEELTQVRRPAAKAAPTVTRRGSARNWLETEPDEFDAPPVRAARVGRRRRPVWPRILAPFAFLAAVIAIFSLTVDSGVLNDSGGGKAKSDKPSASGPAKPRAKVYVVKEGDTLSAIAVKFDTTTAELLRLNPTVSSTTVNPGQKIKLPQD